MQSKPFKIRAFGPLACFTRPETSVDRESYEVMTPSAARKLFEAILWKPAIRWHVHEIAVLKPVTWVSFRNDEMPGQAAPRGGGDFDGEASRRAQGNTVALRDVDYVITASFVMTDQAKPTDKVAKFERMFAQRMAKGQRHYAPSLGEREFLASVQAAPEEVTPIEAGVDRALGRMFYDVEHRTGHRVRPFFFEARLTGGVLHVPSWEEVLREHAAAGG
ncbi:type I-C CRISPR-associated protein Cas5c [Chondromyces crocatus]|uniref:pre-crRNA processing endonuclease n=1 Tax=Chondromyces crocatus TaxID=52 RepID=A0A0K1ELH1_CHOCO|nr:type I-C CRISPR-associated protein Cas5c [Chondromyces crocatus]AKT41522.1 CRISPR-associated protein Cas5 [Chondromyces crocatus]